MRIKSGYARLDVTTGRRLLKQKLDDGKMVEVVIRGLVDREPFAMSDDGTSIEFFINVTSVEVSHD